jgi:hypothetical protein
MEQMAKHLTERRRYPRINSLNLISYIQRKQGAQKSGVSMARTIDISPAGVGLEVYQPINPGSFVEMEIGVKEQIFFVEGKVVYSRNLPNGHFSIGIMFRKMEMTLIKELY